METKKLNIVLETYADFGMAFTLRDYNDQIIDLTDAKIEAHLRQFAESNDYYPFAMSHNGPGGRVKMNMPHEMTAEVPYSSGVYDVRIEFSDGTVAHPLEGDVRIVPSATRPYTGKPLILLAVSSFDALPAVGKIDRLYYTYDDNCVYRWNGSNYVTAVDNNSIIDIEEIDYTDLVHTHRILLANGNYYDFEVTDGESPVLEWGNITGTLSDQEDLYNILTAKADAADVYDKDTIDALLLLKADADHNHDSRYYTETEVDTALSGKAPVNHNHNDLYYGKSDIDTALSGKSDAAHTHDNRYYTEQEVDDLLDGKSDTTHNHDVRYYKKGTVDDALAGKADTSHTHDGRYYLKSEMDTALSGKSDSTHNHDDRYYQESEVDTLLSAKANTNDLGTLSVEDDAPSDNKKYARKNGEWTEITEGGSDAPEWGEITGTLTDQLDLKAALQDKAPVILSSASGSIASFPDGSPAPVTALTVGIEPVQDLHGYSNPWPAGGGANVMPTITAGTYTSENLTAVVGADGTIKVTGTKASGSSETIYMDYTTAYACPQNYYLHLRNSSFTNSNIAFGVGGVSTSLGATDKIYQNTDERTASTRVTLLFNSSVSGTFDFTFQPSIEASSSVTNWTPYSNVCPITGWTQANVTRTGKNMLPNLKYQAGTNQVAIGQEETTNNRTIFLKVGTYTVSVTSSTSGTIYYRGSDNNTNNRLSKSGVLHGTLNVTKAGTFCFWVYNPNGIDIDDITSFQMELSSTASAYEPYQGTSVTIDLGETRYGGTIDVLTGTMTVIHEIVDLGTLTWDNVTGYTDRWQSGPVSNMKYGVNGEPSNLVCSAYQSGVSGYNGANNALSSVIYIYAGGRTLRVKDVAKNGYTGAQFTTAMSGVQLVYPLETPLTVQLSPSTLQTLFGENHIWSSTGDTSVEYRADSKLYIDKVIESRISATKKMIAGEEQELKATKAYTSGEYLWIGDDLYKCLSNIASGTTLVVNTHIQKCTVGEQLKLALS